MLLGKSTGQLMYFSWYSAEKTSAQGDLSVFHTDDCNSYLRGLEASRLLLFFYESVTIPCEKSSGPQG